MRFTGWESLIHIAVAPRVGHTAQQVQVDRMALDLVPVLRVVKQCDAEITLREIHPLVGRHLVPRQVPGGVTVRRAADMSKLDLVGGLISTHGQREAYPQHGACLPPSEVGDEVQAGAACGQHDLLLELRVSNPIHLGQHGLGAHHPGLRAHQRQPARGLFGIVHGEIPGVARVGEHHQIIGPLAGWDQLTPQTFVVQREDRTIVAELHTQHVIFQMVRHGHNRRRLRPLLCQIQDRIPHTRGLHESPDILHLKPLGPRPGERVVDNNRTLHTFRVYPTGQDRLPLNRIPLHLL